MPYEITLKPAFLAGLVQLGHKDQKKVVKTIGDNPFQPQTTKILKHTYKNLYRLRAGNYRIVFAVGSGTVALVAVEHRSTIYTHLQPRGSLKSTPSRSFLYPTTGSLRTFRMAMIRRTPKRTLVLLQVVPTKRSSSSTRPVERRAVTQRQDPVMQDAGRAS